MKSDVGAKNEIVARLGRVARNRITAKLDPQVWSGITAKATIGAKLELKARSGTTAQVEMRARLEVEAKSETAAKLGMQARRVSEAENGSATKTQVVVMSHVGWIGMGEVDHCQKKGINGRRGRLLQMNY